MVNQTETYIDISATIEKLRYEVIDIDNGEVRRALQDHISAMKRIIKDVTVVRLE